MIVEVLRTLVLDGKQDRCLGLGPRAHLHYKGDLFLTSRFDPLDKAGVLVKIQHFFRFRTRSDEFSTQEEKFEIKDTHGSHIRWTRTTNISDHNFLYRE
jgi:hypothetical protein